MVVHTRSSARDYYDVSPTNKHATGDIWAAFPGHSLLKSPTCSALVITPACDLANDKVETITYLPIVSIRHYFSLAGFFPEVRTALVHNLRQLEMPGIDDMLPKGGLPTPDGLKGITQFLIEHKAAPATADNKSLLSTISRCEAGVDHVHGILNSDLVPSSLQQLGTLFATRDWLRIRQGIVRNAYRADLHFLPADREDTEWSAIPEHSVVLFRYPFTVSLEVLRLATITTREAWPETVELLSKTQPAATPFKHGWPLKTLRLKNDFLSDLLTRFAALYLRIGSPDFTEEAVNDFAEQLAG